MLPTGSEAQAVELIKCLLLSAECAGELPTRQREVLLRRYTAEQLAAAYTFLCAQDQVYAGGISKAYALSDAFKASLQVCSYLVLQESQSACQVHACLGAGLYAATSTDRCQWHAFRASPQICALYTASQKLWPCSCSKTQLQF